MPVSIHKPAYLLHKPTGQARVRIDSKDHYLGAFGSKESRERYDELIEKWTIRNSDALQYTLTIDDLALLYLKHAEKHYQKAGVQTSEVKCIKTALRFLLKWHGTKRARDFGPKSLKAVRESMIAAGWKRKSINIHVGRIRRMFSWATSEELLPVTVYQALATVAGLREGRSDAEESVPVQPVSDELVRAIQPFVSRPVWGMIQLQRITGARPGEIASVRGCDLNMAGKVWEYVPGSHKTSHHGKRRIIFLGPKAQEVVRAFLKPDLQSPLFDPREGRSQFLEGTRSNRRKQTGKRQASTAYTSITYAVAVRRACVKAKIPHWHPHQLRHTAATEIRREAGLETARVVLGHSTAAMTEVYAQADEAMARKIMGKIG